MDDERLPEGTYLIPRRIARGYELLPGIGLRDAVFPAAGLVLGILLWFGLQVFGTPFLYRALGAILPMLLGGVLALPIEEVHVWEFIRDIRAFGRIPKTLLYDWTRDDW